MPAVRVEVFMLFNQSSRMTEEESLVHEQAWSTCLSWVEHHKASEVKFTLININGFPDPQGGVGWARKVVMDEAARILSDEGIIVCLDADCLVEKNYLTTIADHFNSNPDCIAVSIYYEHELDALEPSIRKLIVQYELHLRYLVHAMRWAGHPFAFQTVGSAMAVRRKAYLAQGGMNTRQAGEDFYFLQKFIETGTLHEIKGTTVFPSARTSARVPFGTGRAMQFLGDEKQNWKTTSLQVFSELKPLFYNLEKLRQIVQTPQKSDIRISIMDEMGISQMLWDYLDGTGFIRSCSEIVSHTTTAASYRKRFFRYFNAFRIIRYTHAMRDTGYPDVLVSDAAGDLAVHLDPTQRPMQNAEELLCFYRTLDRGVAEKNKYL